RRTLSCASNCTRDWVFWANQEAIPDISPPIAAPVRPARAGIIDMSMACSLSELRGPFSALEAALRPQPGARRQSGQVARQSVEQALYGISASGSRVALYVIPTDEELMIARHTLAAVPAAACRRHPGEPSLARCCSGMLCVSAAINIASITRSTPARLYQERSKRMISPAAGKCAMYRWG